MSLRAQAKQSHNERGSSSLQGQGGCHCEPWFIRAWQSQNYLTL